MEEARRAVDEAVAKMNSGITELSLEETQQTPIVDFLSDFHFITPRYRE